MTDLDTFIGTLLSGISHARRLSDEQSAAIAEAYRDHPLLSGMTVPRVRIPEMTLELPVLIESHQQGEPARPKPKNVMVKSLSSQTKAFAKEGGITLNATFIKSYEAELAKQVDRLGSDVSNKLNKEQAYRLTERAFLAATQKHNLNIEPRVNQALLEKLRSSVAEAVFETEPAPPKVKINVLTADIKDKASPANVARIKLTLKEEGLEWHSVEHSDGTTRDHLSPE